MFQIIKSMLSDVDNQASTKRFAMLYLLVIIWTFVHVVVFMILKAMDLGKNLIFYDFILIASFGGLVLMEKIYGRPSIGQAPVPDAPPQTDVTAKPRDDKSEAVHP